MSPSVFPYRLPWHERLSEAGGEALLPAGWRLADEGWPGRNCFLLVEGEADACAGGEHVTKLGSGAFVGRVDAAGGPQVPGGFTVRLITQARVLVLDVDRLAALIDADPEIAAAWRQMLDGGRS